MSWIKKFLLEYLDIEFSSMLKRPTIIIKLILLQDADGLTYTNQ